MGLSLIKAPEELPVTRDSVKAYLDVDHTVHDNLLDGFIAEVTAMLDGVTGTLHRAVMRQTWLWTRHRFPAAGKSMAVPLGPLHTVASIKYTDPDGAEQTMPPADYVARRDAFPGRISPAPGKAWPVTQGGAGAVRVEYEAGYELTPGTGDEAMAVPANLQLGIKVEISERYRHRDDTITGTSVTMTKATQRILGPFKVPNIGPADLAPEDDPRPAL